MKNPSDPIWNGTRDFPACSAVSQPTAPQRTPIFFLLGVSIPGPQGLESRALYLGSTQGALY